MSPQDKKSPHRAGLLSEGAINASLIRCYAKPGCVTASIASVISATAISTVAVFITCFPLVVVRYVCDHDRQPADRLGNNTFVTSLRPLQDPVQGRNITGGYQTKKSPHKAG